VIKGRKGSLFVLSRWLFRICEADRIRAAYCYRNWRQACFLAVAIKQPAATFPSTGKVLLLW